MPMGVWVERMSYVDADGIVGGGEGEVIICHCVL